MTTMMFVITAYKIKSIFYNNRTLCALIASSVFKFSSIIECLIFLNKFFLHFEIKFRSCRTNDRNN